jgi:hypothetical protein
MMDDGDKKKTNKKIRCIQRVPELAPYPCMADTESLNKLIFVKKKCPGFKGLRVRDY